MRHLFHILACLLLFVGCQSKEDKANKLIDEYMFKHLHDYKSYEVVETTIDTLYNSPLTDLECINLAISANEHLEKCVDYSGDAERDDRSMDIWSGGWSSTSRSEYKKAYKSWLTHKIGETQERIEYLKELKSIFKKAESLSGKEQIGWIASHTFRSNTLAGNSSLGNYMFFIDKDFKTILASYSDEDELEEAIPIITDAIVKYDSADAIDSLIVGWSGLIDKYQDSLNNL